MGDNITLTRQQAEQEMNTLRRLFTSVRLVHEGEREEACAAVQEAFRTGKQVSRLEFVGDEVFQIMAEYVCVDGSPCVIEMANRNPAGSVVGTDSGDIAGRLKQYHTEVYTDVMTGAFNRRYYEEKLRHSHIEAGVVMIDLDDFKLYNDTMGHGAGDEVLTSVVNSVRRCIRDTDILVRTGGDEFLLVLPGMTTEIFSKKLDMISRRVACTVVSGYPGIRPTISMGGVIACDEALESAVERADKLMYIAKERKNSVVTEQTAQEQEHEDKLDILIVEDNEMNRLLLSRILESTYTVHTAENGKQALEKIEQLGTRLSIVLLDIIMPVMNGFDVLKAMNASNIIDDIPVIMISSDDAAETVRKSFSLGVSDFIGKPYDASVVKQRVNNTIKLFAKQRRLVKLLSEQISEKDKNNRMMISILSHIVEFRNGESGLHVLHIQELTEMLLDQMIKRGRCAVSPEEAGLIPLASALHDIGKIGIDDAILNKPGRLTPEEFAIMKTHSVIGAEMLDGLEQFQDEPLVKIARQICRWHHERWDGRGYPDGLSGDQIPIAAQVVSVADVYDALVSRRVYKEPFPHETAVQMILDGECGAFAPELLDSFLEIQDDIRKKFAQ